MQGQVGAGGDGIEMRKPDLHGWAGYVAPEFLPSLPAQVA